MKTWKKAEKLGIPSFFPSFARNLEGYAARVEAGDFPGETFRVLKEREMQRYREYRTRRLVLEAW